MIIAVASGKGGTGKTTVSASLSQVWEAPVVSVDLDVEEPNLGLFLHPDGLQTEQVAAEIPVLDMGKCTLCRICADFCQFKAITILGKTPAVFPEMCHSCGGCLALCPEGALIAGERELGCILQGDLSQGPFLMGRLRIGEAMSPPLIQMVKKRLRTLLEDNAYDAVIDAPPGVSCPAVNAVSDSDVIVLVTEPTPFGLHDLALAVEAFRPLGKPMGVVINRDGIGDAGVRNFCTVQKLPILAGIPFQREIAAAYSQGQCISRVSRELELLFSGLRDAIRALAHEKGVPHA